MSYVEEAKAKIQAYEQRVATLPPFRGAKGQNPSGAYAPTDEERRAMNYVETVRRLEHSRQTGSSGSSFIRARAEADYIYSGGSQAEFQAKVREEDRNREISRQRAAQIKASAPPMDAASIAQRAGLQNQNTSKIEPVATPPLQPTKQPDEVAREERIKELEAQTSKLYAEARKIETPTPQPDPRYTQNYFDGEPTPPPTKGVDFVEAGKKLIAAQPAPPLQPDDDSGILSSKFTKSVTTPYIEKKADISETGEISFQFGSGMLGSKLAEKEYTPEEARKLNQQARREEKEWIEHVKSLGYKQISIVSPSGKVQNVPVEDAYRAIASAPEGSKFRGSLTPLQRTQQRAIQKAEKADFLAFVKNEKQLGNKEIIFIDEKGQTKYIPIEEAYYQFEKTKPQQVKSVGEYPQETTSPLGSFGKFIEPFLFYKSNPVMQAIGTTLGVAQTFVSSPYALMKMGDVKFEEAMTGSRVDKPALVYTPKTIAGPTYGGVFTGLVKAYSTGEPEFLLNETQTGIEESKNIAGKAGPLATAVSIGTEAAVVLGKGGITFIPKKVLVSARKALATSTYTKAIEYGPVSSPKTIILEPTPLTKTIRPTNPYRTPIPKDIFALDTAPSSGMVSERIPTPRNPSLEDVTKETQSKLQSIQKNLIETQPSKPTQQTSVQQEPFFTPSRPDTRLTGETPIEDLASGKPPITTPSSPDIPLSRSEVVEATRLLSKHEVFSPSGKKIGTFGSVSEPLGALGKTEKPKLSTISPEEANPLGRLGISPIKTPSSFDIPISRATIVEETTPRLGHEVFSAKGILIGRLGDIAKPLGALGKTEKPKLVESNLVQQEPFFTPSRPDTRLTGETPIEDLASGKPPITTPSSPDIPLSRSEVVEATRLLSKHEVFSPSGKKIGLVGDVSKPLGALRKPKLLEVVEPIAPEETNPLGRRGKPPIIRPVTEELPPPRSKKVELESKLFPKTGIGALGKTEKQKLVEEEKGFKPEIKEFYTKPGKIDTDKLLGIDKPTIGASTEFMGALEKLKEKKKQITPTSSEQAFRSFISSSEKKYKEPESKSTGQQLIQVKREKLATKPATSQLTKRKTKREVETTPLIQTPQEDDDTYLNLSRPRTATKSIYKTSPKSNISKSLGLISTPLSKTTIDVKPKVGSKITPLIAQTPKIKTEIIPTLGQPQKISQNEAQKLLQSPDESGKPKPKLKQPTPEIPRLATRQKPDIPFPRNPRLSSVFALPPSKNKLLSKPKPQKPGARADFLGNVPVTSLVGVYKKRPDIIYGRKRTSKLVGKEIALVSSGKFTKGSSKLSSKPRKNIFTTKKKQKAYKL